VRIAIALMLVSACSIRAQHYPILSVPNSPRGIFVMMQDRRSGLWMGTIDDVLCYDGLEFFSLRAFGFPKETANSLAEDADGAIWIATQGTAVNGGATHGGIYRYKVGRLEKLFSGDGLSLLAIGSVGVLASVGTELSGKPSYGDLLIFHKEQGRWSSNLMLSRQVNHMTLDHQGNVLFPCPGGWCELYPEQIRGWRKSAAQLDLHRHTGSPLVERVLRDRFGCVWFRAEAFASYQCSADTKPISVPSNISRYDSSAHLEETADGSVFMLVPMALGRPNAFHIATQSKNGLPSQLDTAMVARDGTIWIGADSGLYRFPHPFQIETWGLHDGIGGPYSIVSQNNEILATSGESIVHLAHDRSHWDLVPGSRGLGGALALGPNGMLFSANSHSLAQLRLKAGVIAMSRLHSFTPDTTLASTPNGTLWLGQEGLSQVKVKGSQFDVRPTALPKNSISALQYNQRSQTLWACDGAEIVYREGNMWSAITPALGLPGTACRSIAISSNGDLWAGFQGPGGGVTTRIQRPTSDNRTIKNYTDHIGTSVPSDLVYFLGIDRRNWIWRGRAVLYLAAANSAQDSRWLVLDKQDGIDPTKVFGNSFLSDHDGSVWFGTIAGITHFSPPPDFATRFPQPQVFISGFSVNGGVSFLADTVSSLPNDAAVIANVGCLQFDRRNSLHVRYRCLPEEPNWQYTSGLRIPLGKRRWGHQALQVQAEMQDGPWSTIAEQSFTVLAPAWLSWPALLLYGLSGTGLGAGALRWKRYQRLKREMQLPDISAWRLSALSPEANQLIGTVIDDRYEIGHILSVGGFSAVLMARDRRNGGRLCAIKIFRYDIADRAWIRHRFEQEVSALERLSHPNIVKITGHGAIDTGAPYLVMEFLEGRSLRQELDAGPIARTKIARLVEQISNALAALHRRCIYHRDVKPENLMICTRADNAEQLVLIDFSIALVKSADHTFHGISRVAGTLGYMAPEQVIGFADASTDIHSLAKVVMEMLTGSRWTDLLPQGTLDMAEFVHTYFTKHRHGLSVDSVVMLASALAFDPLRRPKDVIRFAAPIICDLNAS